MWPVLGYSRRYGSGERRLLQFANMDDCVANMALVAGFLNSILHASDFLKSTDGIVVAVVTFAAEMALSISLGRYQIIIKEQK
ncbi:unnamed protein product [Rodentolepis nana]|uniref:DUF2512 family protein n=1 Tax=Rodentolepis nana TaxID=102285 RepID=A0A0R3TAR4_RODNA|nr:unnamed protein product [Rodentolepis nana]